MKKEKERKNQRDFLYEWKDSAIHFDCKIFKCLNAYTIEGDVDFLSRRNLFG